MVGSWMGSGRHFVVAPGRLAQQIAEKKIKGGEWGVSRKSLGKWERGGALVFPENAKNVTACQTGSSLARIFPSRLAL